MQIKEPGVDGELATSGELTVGDEAAAKKDSAITNQVTLSVLVGSILMFM